MKKWVLLILTVLLCAGCGGRGMSAEVWIEDHIPQDGTETLNLPAFPGVTFTYTSATGKVSAERGEETKDLFTAGPFGALSVCNVYLCDLTGDGKPELCATVSLGSGIAHRFVIVEDYASCASYKLANRDFFHDYVLEMRDGALQVVESKNKGILWTDSPNPEVSCWPLALIQDRDGILRLTLEK